MLLTTRLMRCESKQHSRNIRHDREETAFSLPVASTLLRIHHMDLYRLPGTSPKDFEPLNLSNVFQNSISLIEWPSRLLAFPQLLPPIENVLQIDIRIVPRLEKRKMILTAIHKSCWKERLQYLADEGMLDDLLWDNNEEDDGNGNDNDSLESQ